MPVRTADAVWEGSVREGKGRVKLGSGLCESEYSYSSRFYEGEGTNPEELLGAAHAGCFSLAFASRLRRAGFPPERIHTIARVRIEEVGASHQITHIELETEATVPGIDEETFLERAQAAKRECPVSMALTGVEITLSAKLLEA